MTSAQFVLCVSSRVGFDPYKLGSSVNGFGEIPIVEPVFPPLIGYSLSPRGDRALHDLGAMIHEWKREVVVSNLGKGTYPIASRTPAQACTTPLLSGFMLSLSFNAKVPAYCGKSNQIM
jgi:hypothetical protein